MVGPGLVLAVALCVTPGRAEIEVGLQAQGVDPAFALDNRLGLDLRDELGRPVTTRQVLKDLKAATVERTRVSAWASKLREAKTILPYLELLARLAAAFQLRLPLTAIAELLPGLPGGRPKSPVPVLALLGMAVAAALTCWRRNTDRIASRSRQSRPEVLRC